MSNEEIKTALNCCMEWTANGGKTDCANCPMDKSKPCHINLHLAALKRIEELEAANKKLQDEVDSLCNENDGLELRAESLDEQLTRKTRQLEAENAALRERLEKAVELPFSIGDMAYYCDYIDYKGYVIIERKIVGIKQIKNEPKWWDRRESFMAAIVQGKKQCNDEIGEWCYDIDAFGTEWWTDRAAAEKRLAELGGEK